MSVEIRLMTTRDIPAATRLKDTVGWNQTLVDWQRFVSANPHGCFSAEYDGQLIGISTTIVYENRFAWIGTLIVHPEHRQKGLGTALLDRAINYLDSREVSCIKLDATPQGKPLYEKLGFETEYIIDRWMLRRQRGGKTGQKFLVEIHDLLEIDRETFGADRSWLLRSLNEEAPDFTLMAKQEARVTGYSFGRRGSFADQLGPWVARDKDVAAVLLDEFLHRSQRELVFVDCMSPNAWAAQLVKTRGFEFSWRLTRMVRGTNEYPGQPEFVCASLGPEYG